jgi:hypothetical protein
MPNALLKEGSVSDMQCRMVHWTLFTALVLIVPIPFFLFQLGALMPLASIVSWGLMSLYGRVSGIAVLSLIHVAVFGPVLWFAARLLTAQVLRVPGQGLRTVCHLMILGALLLLAALGPYGVGGHSNSQHWSWLHTFKP